MSAAFGQLIPGMVAEDFNASGARDKLLAPFPW